MATGSSQARAVEPVHNGGAARASNIATKLYLAGCLAGSSLAYSLFLSHGFAPAVVGYNLVPAERVLNGELPYRDFLYNYTPGVLWSNSLLFTLFGTSLMTARAGVFAARLATIMLVLALARRFLPGWLAVLPVLMTLAWIGYGDVLKVFPTQYGMALLLGACLAGIKAGETESAKSRLKWLALAGVLSGLVFVFKQNVGLFALAAGCATAIVISAASTERRSRLKTAGAQVAIVFGGFATIVAGMLAYLAAKGALAPMIAHFARHATAYAEEKGIPLPRLATLALASVLLLGGAAFVALVARSRYRLAGAFIGLTAIALTLVVANGDTGAGGVLYRSLRAEVYYLPLLLTAGVAALTVLRSRRDRRRESGSRTNGASLRDLIVLSLFSLAAFLEIFPRSDADHLVRMLPPALVLLCGLALAADRWLIRRAGATSSRGPARYGAPVLIGVVAVVTALGIRVTWLPQFDRGFQLLESEQLSFERGRHCAASELEARRMNDVVAYVQSHTAPGDPIFSISRKMSGIYFLAERPNITRLVWFDSAGVSEDERRAVERRIEGREFKLVLTLGEYGPESDRGEMAVYDRTLRVVEANYALAAVVRDVNMYVPRAGQVAALNSR